MDKNNNYTFDKKLYDRVSNRVMKQRLINNQKCIELYNDLNNIDKYIMRLYKEKANLPWFALISKFKIKADIKRFSLLSLQVKNEIVKIKGYGISLEDLKYISAYNHNKKC